MYTRPTPIHKDVLGRGWTGVESQHEVNLAGRQELSVSGVTHVEHYNHREVVVATTMGLLVIAGEDLSIDHLNIEEGRLALRGHIASLTYTDQGRPSSRGRGLWQKLWR